MSDRRGFLARLGGLLGVVATCGPRALTAIEPTTPAPAQPEPRFGLRGYGPCERCREVRELVWTESAQSTGITGWGGDFLPEPSGPVFETRYCEPCARAMASE